MEIFLAEAGTRICDREVPTKPINLCTEKWYIHCDPCGLTKTKTGSSQVGAISKAQKYSKNNYWKHLEKLFF